MANENIVQVVTKNNLAESDFTVEGGKVHLLAKVGKINISRYYTVPGGSHVDDRKLAVAIGGVLFIHLDVQLKADATKTYWVGTLPNEIPAPTHLIEKTENGARFYIDPGQRQILVSNAKLGERYTVDLMGVTV